MLYERTYGELVARAILSALGARGHALVADPGRLGRAEFLDVCARGGLAGEVNEIPYEEGPVKQRIALFDLRRV